MAIGRSLSRAVRSSIEKDAQRSSELQQKALEESAALEARRKELADAGTPFLTTDKLGDLVFEDDSFYTDYKIADQVVGKDFVFYDPMMSVGAKAANQVVRYTGGIQPEYRYTFIPENIIEKGFKTDDKQYYLGNILAGDNLDALSQKGVYVDLAGVKNFDKEFKDQGISTKGFLIPYAETQQRDLFSNIKNYEIGKASEDNTIKWGEIKGLSKSGDQYVYATDATPIGGVDQASGYIDAGGLKGNWYKKPSGGGVLGDIGRAIASVPFGAELLGLASALNPITAPYSAAIYGGAAGLRGGGTGQDPLKVGLETGIKAGIAASLGGPGAEGAGAEIPSTMATSTPAPGSFQAALPELGVQTAATTPGFTALPGSFQAALPSLIAPVNAMGDTAQGLLNQDLDFLAEETANLYQASGGDLNAIQQNLIANGVDPVVAAEAANQASLSMGNAAFYDVSGAVPVLKDAAGQLAAGMSGIKSGIAGAFPGEAIITSQGLLSGGATLDDFAKDIANISSTSGAGLGAKDLLNTLRAGKAISDVLNPPSGGQVVGGGLAGGGFQPTGVEFPLAGISQVRRASLPDLGPVISPFISPERLGLLQSPYQTNLLGYQPNYSLLG